MLDAVRAAAAASAPISVEPRAAEHLLAEHAGALPGRRRRPRRRSRRFAAALPQARSRRRVAHASGAFVPHVTLDQRIDPDRLPHALAALADYRTSYCFERLTVLEQDAEHRWQPLADAALGKPTVAGRGSLDLELSVVDRPDPARGGVGRRAVGAVLHEPVTARRSGPIEPYAIVARSERASPSGFADGEIRGPVCRLGRLIVSPDWRDRGVGFAPAARRSRGSASSGGAPASASRLSPAGERRSSSTPSGASWSLATPPALARGARLRPYGTRDLRAGPGARRPDVGDTGQPT